MGAPPKPPGRAGPCVYYAVAKAVKKGEDFFIALPGQPWPGTEAGKGGKGVAEGGAGDDTGESTYGIYAILDGHNGRQAAEYAAEILPTVFQEELTTELRATGDATAAVQQALCNLFIELDRKVITMFTYSGCTLTTIIQHGWHIYVASVGDSRAVLYDGFATSQLTYDFRVEDSELERTRILASGATVGRLAFNGRGPVVDSEAGCGPLRVWPGGLCLSRAIGDPDVGDCIIPHPYYKHMSVPGGPVRVILATDGVWDAVSNQLAVAALRTLNTETACTELVDLSISRRGLRDDTTVVVIDLTPNGQNITELWGVPQTNPSSFCGLCGGGSASVSIPVRYPPVEEVEVLDFYSPSPVVTPSSKGSSRGVDPRRASEKSGLSPSGHYRKPPRPEGVIDLTVPSDVLVPNGMQTLMDFGSEHAGLNLLGGPPDDPDDDEDVTVRGHKLYVKPAPQSLKETEGVVAPAPDDAGANPQ